jgi:hypothetical protein
MWTRRISGLGFHRAMQPKIVLPVALATGLLVAAPAHGQEAPPEREAARIVLDEPNTALRSVVDYHAGRAWWYGATTVCAAPCTARVPIDGTYQVVGEGMPASSVFSLPRDRGDVRLDVHPGNATTHDVATVVLIVGSVLAGVGLVLLASNALDGTTSLSRPEMQTGLALAGGGVVGLGVSIPLLIANATTVRFQ